MDSKLICLLSLAILVTVFTAGIGYYLFSHPNHRQNVPSQMPAATTQEPTPSSETAPSAAQAPVPLVGEAPAKSVSESRSTPSPSENQTESALLAKPSVPEFTARYVDYSYDVPPTYWVDQFTGKTVTTKTGYHVNNRTVEFTIKNQPFSPYEDASGSDVGLYYNFRFKGAFGSEWSYYPFKPDGYSTIPYGMLTGDLSPKLFPSNAEYTNLSVDLDVLLSISSGYTGSFTFPSGGQIEFQAQAIVGRIDCEASGLLAGSYYTFKGETSEWSVTQIVGLP